MSNAERHMRREQEIERANKHEAKQIVVDPLGQSGTKNIKFGSVAGSLIQTSPVPVVVVP